MYEGEEGAPGAEATPTIETPNGTVPAAAEPAAAAESDEQVDVLALIREEAEAQTAPLRARINELAAENVVLSGRLAEVGTRVEAPAPSAEPTDAEILERLKKDPLGTVRQIAREAAEAAANEAASGVETRTNITTALTEEKRQVLGEMPELEANPELLGRADAIYKLKAKSGYRPGMIRDAANQAYLEFMRAGKVTPPKPSKPVEDGPRERARSALQNVSLRPSKAEKPDEISVESDMAKEFDADELRDIKAYCARSKMPDGKPMTLAQFYKSYKSKQSQDPNYGFKGARR